MNATETVEQLNSFLRGELSAIESYEEALCGRPGLSQKHELGQCMASHLQRAQMLREKIESMGGTPAGSSGVWGTLAKLVEKGAVSLSDAVTVRALEEGEDIGLKDYRIHIPEVDPETREFLGLLLAEQKRTHETLEKLVARLTS